MKQYKRALFLFRRDLRLYDNTALIAALENAQEVLPAFIFDPRQADPKENEYFSPHAFQFLVRSLGELQEELRKKGSDLYLYEGNASSVLQKVLKDASIDAVYVNRDYTPFSRKRDEALETVCKEASVAFHSYDDVALSPVDVIRTGNGDPYKVFTPFMKQAKTYDVRAPQQNTHTNYFSGVSPIPTVSLQAYDRYDNHDLFAKGGRTEALDILSDDTFLADYAQDRDKPYVSGTSGLSAHHKFGTISIRETYQMAKEATVGSYQFVNELYWRDFYLHIAYHFPKVFGESFLSWGAYIAWENDEEKFNDWCAGKTGVPMVDAGMRQLNTTGWMHNRLRMVVASYLTKNLLIDWRWGERYFATKLVDYDPASNNGGWQWSASVGADPKPLRIFNPYTQAQRFDPKGEYIRQWVSELSDVDPELLSDGKTYDLSVYADYPKPLVDQKESYHRAQEVYKKAKEAFQQGS